MSTIEIRGATTDNYTVLSEYDASANLEVAICQTLVQSAYSKVAIDPSNGVYISPANNSHWNSTDLSANLINTSAISNYPSGTVTEYSVISSALTTDVSLNSYTTNISSNSCANNSYHFSSLNTSASYYESNYVFKQNLIADCSDNQTGTYVRGTFNTSMDVTNPNSINNNNKKTQYAMQSRWNTRKGPYNNGLDTVGPDPTAITQDVSFNTLSAFAQYGSGSTDADYKSYWYSCNGHDGSLRPHEIDASYQPIENNFFVKDRDLSDNDFSFNIVDDVGIFRIQQPSNIIKTQVILGGDDVARDISDNDLNNMPLFNGYDLLVDSSKNLLPVPGIMVDTKFKTLFNDEVYNTVADEWTFKIDISSNEGGYDIDEDHPLMTDLVNTNLYDNPYYMENYVSNDHSIEFSNAGILIRATTGGDGDASVASTISIDLSNGETLNSSYAGVDGQIIMNTNTTLTRTTDLSNNDIIDNFMPRILYSNDGVSGLTTLSDEEMENPYLAGMWQKVAEHSSVTTYEYWLKKNNNAIMSLYTDELVDSKYQENDFDFSFNKTLFGDSDIRLWKITGSNNIIVNPQSLYADASYNTVVTTFATSGVLTGLTDVLTNNNYRIVLTAKQKNNISLARAVEGVEGVEGSQGWDLVYSDVSDIYLKTNSDQAFSRNNLVSVAFNDDVINYIDESNNEIYYSYTYYSVQQSSSLGGLSDYVDISFNDGTKQQNITIQQTEMTRVYDTSENIIVNVPDASYNFTGSFYTKSAWQLVYVTINSTYKSTFPAHFGPFSNINLTVKDIIQVNKFYAIQHISNQQLAPYSALKHVHTDIIDYDKIYETIHATDGNTLTISGVFTKTDLKPFMSITQATDTNDVWSDLDLGVAIDTDVYYGLTNTETITQNGSHVNVNTIIEYTHAHDVGSLVQEKYYIPFVYDQSGNSFVLESFHADSSNLESKTDIASSEYLNNVEYLKLSNGYNNVKIWDTNKYNLTITHDSTTTTFTAIDTDTSSNTVFEISVLNNTIFLGTYIVSYIPQDYYRVERKLGGYDDDFDFSQNFITTNYDMSCVDLAPLLQGVNIANTQKQTSTTSGGVINTDVTFINNLSESNAPKLGGYQSFRVLGDRMSINEVGSTVSPTQAENELGTPEYNSGSLTFQYVSGANYSAGFTFPKYRGYFSSTNNQIYTIDRDSTSVTFNIDGSNNSSLTDTLTSNMYYNEYFVVNNLRNSGGGGNLVANLNLTGSFNYSIPPESFVRTYQVTVKGDAVTVTINNQNYIGDATNIGVHVDATLVVDPKEYSVSMTLKDYGTNAAYTFSGQWQGTEQLMAIRPSRVKLNNTAYSYDRFVYKIQQDSQPVRVYKALTGLSNSFNWLGNPKLNGSQNYDELPPGTMWQSHKTYTVSDIYDGINIGKKVVYQNPNLVVGSKLVYIVSAPPYYKFDQIDISNCPVIPYDYSTEYPSNKQVRYMPYIDKTTSELNHEFHPFYNTSYLDINNLTTTVNSNPDLLNDVKFTLTSPSSITAAIKDHKNTRYGIKVPGTNLTVFEYNGSHPITNPGSHTNNPVWVGPVTSIPSTPNINNNALIFRNRDVSGGIVFSALQYPASVGYPSGANGYEHVLRTDVSSNWYNIDFYMGNSSWFNNYDDTYFNTDAHGIKPTLYTVVDLNNPDSQINKRRVYKYNSHMNIDIDISNGKTSGFQTFNLSFNSRSYHDFNIGMNNTFPSNENSQWLYNNLLGETKIQNNAIHWISDDSFSGTSIISWSFGNSNTSTQMLIELFSVQNNQNKWVYIHLLPFMRYMNQFNMQVGSVSWDGSVTAPLVSTRVIELAPALDDHHLINNTFATQQYSESTLKNL